MEIQLYPSPLEYNASSKSKLLSSWCERSLTKYYPFSIILTAIVQGKVFLATDGSYMESLNSRWCSGSWLLVHVDGYILLSSVAFLYYNKANAYVGGLIGILGSLITLRFLLSQSLHTEYLPLHIHSDCKGALNWLLFTRRRIKNKMDHCVIIRGIDSELSAISIQISAVHVNAYLDDSKSWKDLSLVERANCFCDSLAKRFLRNAIETKAIPYPLTLLNWNLTRYGAIIYGNNDNYIRCNLTQSSLIPFLHIKGLPSDMFHKISWDLLANSLKGFPECFQLWHSKHISNFSAIGKKMVYRKEWISARCRYSLLVNETDTFHIFQCINKELRLTRNLFFVNFFNKLEQIDTDPDIIKIYKNVLFTSISLTWNDPILTSAYFDLQPLGSKQVLRGSYRHQF